LANSRQKRRIRQALEGKLGRTVKFELAGGGRLSLHLQQGEEKSLNEIPWLERDVTRRTAIASFGVCTVPYIVNTRALPR
jgi:hypothetical protein